MAEIGLNYSIDEDGIVRMQKDLNYLLTHLDHQNVTRLYTNYCSIQSEYGETWINGPLLTMKTTASTTIRLLAGYDASTGDFVFKLFDVNGLAQISLNSSGEAIFGGNVITGKDILCKHIVVGSETTDSMTAMTSNTYGIYMRYPGTTQYMAAIYSTNIGGGVYQFEIESSHVFNMTAKQTFRIYCYSGYDFVSTATITDTDYMELWSVNHRIFINTCGLHSNTDRGLFLGDQLKHTFLGLWANSTSRIATEGHIRHGSITNDLMYFAGRNTKTIWSSGSTTLTPNTTVNTGTTSSTNGIVARSPGKIKSHINTTGAYVMAYASITSLDITAFNDNSPATTDDYLVFIFHIDTTAIASTTWGVFCQIGQDASTLYTYKYGSTWGYPFTTGFNVMSRKIGSFTTVNGVPNFNDIKYVRFGFMTATTATTGMGICPDYVGIHRVHPSTASTWSDFQSERNSTWQLEWSETADVDKFAVVSYSSDPYVLVNIKPTGNVATLYPLKSALFTNFEVDCDFVCAKDGYSPAVMWWESSGVANNVTVFESANVLYLNIYRNSTLTQYTANVPAYVRNDRVNIKIQKDYQGYVRVIHSVPSAFSAQNVRTLYYSTPFSTAAVGYLAFGSAATTAHTAITKFNFGHYNGRI
jgi:hypothetical protein